MEQFTAYSPEREKIRKEADFKIKEITLIAYNGAEYEINMLRTKLDLYEDIFNNTMSGAIQLQDANDLSQLMPLIGEEKLRIVFTRPDVGSGDPTSEDVELEEINVTFRITKQTNRKLHNDKIQHYRLHLHSEEIIKNLKTKVKTAFVGMPYSTMVQKVYDEKIKVNKPIFIELTQYDQQFVCPNLSPFEMFNCLAARSLSKEGNGAFYTFFEDREQFNYVSIGKLLSQEPVADYIYQVANVLENTDGAYKPRTIDTDIIAIEEYAHAGSFDILNNLYKGMYGSRLVTYDIMRQKIEEYEFDYAKEFDSFKHLDDKRPNTDNLDALGAPDALLLVKSTNKDQNQVPWIASKDPKIFPKHLEDYFLRRRSILQQINNNRIMVKVSGDPRRKVGQVINFKLPKAMGNVTKETPPELDEYLQGKHLIVSLKHELHQNKYYMIMELIKDSFFNEIAHVDPLEVYDPTY